MIIIQLGKTVKYGDGGDMKINFYLAVILNAVKNPTGEAYQTLHCV